MKRDKSIIQRLLLGLLIMASLSFATLIEASGSSTTPAPGNRSFRSQREMVYALVLFDGGKYQETFSPSEIDTLYMMAGVNNVVSARKTDVYYWPLTKEYKADWMESNFPQNGTLEIMKGNKLFKLFRPAEYVLYYPQGTSEGATEVKTGSAITAIVQKYKSDMAQYYQKVLDYYKEYERYNQLMARYANEPQKPGNIRPVEPKSPNPPSWYLTQPDQAFLLNLPQGQYILRFKDQKGRVVPRSERKLICFGPSARGIGYEIIPRDKWTYPMNSNDQSEKILVLKTQAIYLKLFVELQFNEHHYTKIAQLASPSSGKGLENRLRWVHVSPMPATRYQVAIFKNGKLIGKVREKPYFVKQRPGYALGYDIVEFIPKDHPGIAPNFTAFKIDMPKDSGSYFLYLLDANGKAVPGSERNVRIVKKTGLPLLLSIFFLPLVAGAGIVGTRLMKIRNSQC